LHSGPASDPHQGTYSPNVTNSRLNEPKTAIHPANGIVDSGWPVDRDDDLVEKLSHFRGSLGKQEACCQQSETDVHFAKKIAKRSEI
jgi:hypothetical protein